MGLILKDDCRLVVINEKPFITTKNYEIPISRKGAVFISLLNGERSLEEVEEILININLNQRETQKFFVQNLFYQYGHFIVDLEDVENNPNRSYSVKDFLITKNHSQEDFYNTKVPRSIFFHVTESCDKACKYCYMDAQNGVLEEDALKFEEVTKIIDEAADLGIYSIVYMGGEPFLRKDLIDIILYASSKGILSKVTTKFYLKEEQIIKLKGSKVKIGLSYDCHIDELASYLVGRKNHADNMDNVIRMLVKYGIDFSINPVVTGITVKYFKEFLDYLSSLGVTNAVIVRYIPSLGRNSDELLITDEQWKEVISIVKEYNCMKIDFLHHKCDEILDITSKNIDKTPKKIERNSEFCVNGRSELTILPNGKVVICEKLKNKMDFCFGDLKKNTIMEVWNSEERRKLMFPERDAYRGIPCSLCEDFHKCNKKFSCTFNSIASFGTAYMPSYEVRHSCEKYLKLLEKLK